MKRAALYTRISQSDDKVDKPADQEDALRRIAASSGYEVTAVFTDDDISAFEGKHTRPAFESLVARTAMGEFDVVMATEPQRFTRGSASELEALNLAMTKAGAVFHTRAAGVMDPSTPMTQAMLRFQDTLAWLEVATNRERQKARNAADRARGIPKRALRPFGYEVDGMTLRESEAVHIREAVRFVLEEGGSMIRVAHRWNAAGIQTDGMNRERKGRDGVKKAARPYWTATTVRSVLLRKRNAGILMHDGAELPESRIQPIITRAELDALEARVKVGTPVGARAKSALGGIIQCECGAPMHMTSSYSQRKGGPRYEYKHYVCSQKLYDKTRKHASISMPIADTSVALQVLSYIGLGLVTAEDTADYGSRLHDLSDRLAILTEQEARAEDALIEGLGNPARVKGKLEAIRSERVELNAERERIEADRAGGDFLRVVEQMREVLQAVAWDPDDSPLTGLESWAMKSVLEAWNAVEGEDQQALMRGRFRAQVRVGGRGPERVTVTPR